MSDSTPPTLDPAGYLATKTATARLAAAESVARQLQCREQLSPEEQGNGYRIGLNGTPQRVLGDEVLALDDDNVLPFLAANLHELKAFERMLELETSRDLRPAYGYNESRRNGALSTGGKPRRVALRLALCLAADMTFAPYAAGTLEARRQMPSSLWIDLLAMSEAIWWWAHDDCLALAYAFTVARKKLPSDAPGERRNGGEPEADFMDFPAFTCLAAQILSWHARGERGSVDAKAALEAAEILSPLIVRQLWLTGRGPGCEAKQNLFLPIVAALQEHSFAWPLGTGDRETAEELVRGAMNVVIDTLANRVAPAHSLRSLDGLARALDSISEDPDA